MLRKVTSRQKGPEYWCLAKKCFAGSSGTRQQRRRSMSTTNSNSNSSQPRGWHSSSRLAPCLWSRTHRLLQCKRRHITPGGTTTPSAPGRTASTGSWAFLSSSSSRTRTVTASRSARERTTTQVGVSMATKVSDFTANSMKQKLIVGQLPLLFARGRHFTVTEEFRRRKLCFLEWPNKLRGRDGQDLIFWGVGGDENCVQYNFLFGKFQEFHVFCRPFWTSIGVETLYVYHLSTVIANFSRRSYTTEEFIYGNL